MISSGTFGRVLLKAVDLLLSLGLHQSSVRSVAFLMLDKVPAPELIAAAVENSVLSYAEEHDLPIDELLLQYIKVTAPPAGSPVPTFQMSLLPPRSCWSAAALRQQPCSQSGRPKPWRSFAA